MKNPQPIDLNKQLQEMLEKEEMLAFFDFSIEIGKSGPLSGICKISQPREHHVQGQYFAVLFIIDTPDINSRREVAAHMNGVKWEKLKRVLPVVNSVFPVPYMHISEKIYFLELDIYFAGEAAPHKVFFRDNVMPELEKLIPIKAGKPVFWDEEANAGGKAAKEGALWERVRHYLLK